MSSVTKRALAASLKKFLHQTTIDKITVTDIAADCGVNRQTFYYHFQDIYDLGQYMFMEEILKTLGDTTLDDWEKGLVKILKYLEENKALVLNTYYSFDKDYLEGWLYTVFFEMFLQIINKHMLAMLISEEDKEFIVNYNKYALTGLILDWVKRGMKDDPNVMVDKLSNLLGTFISDGL